MCLLGDCRTARKFQLRCHMDTDLIRLKQLPAAFSRCDDWRCAAIEIPSDDESDAADGNWNPLGCVMFEICERTYRRVLLCGSCNLLTELHLESSGERELIGTLLDLVNNCTLCFSLD